MLKMENKLVEFPPPVPARIQRPPKVVINPNPLIFIDGGFSKHAYSNIYDPNWEGYKRNKRKNKQ